MNKSTKQYMWFQKTNWWLFLPLAFAFFCTACGRTPSTSSSSKETVKSWASDCASLSFDGKAANGRSRHPALSWDGSFVAFESDAGNLVKGGKTKFCQLYVRDRVAGRTELISRSTSGGCGNGGSHYASISWDGRFVAFHSYASNLVDGDVNRKLDIFVYDRKTKRTERISEAPDCSDANGTSWNPQIAGRGRYVVFESVANNLVAGDGNLGSDIFRYDREKGITEIVSVAADKGDANGHSFWPAVSADGSLVVFQSQATNLLKDLPLPWDSTNSRGIVQQEIPGARTPLRLDVARIRENWRESNQKRNPTDTNRCRDIFAVVMGFGKTIRVSVGNNGRQANAHSYLPAVSGDGSVVAFTTDASSLDRLEGNGFIHVFVRPMGTGRLLRLNRTSDGQLANGRSFYVALSAYGRWAVFDSEATNLVASDTNKVGDVFVVDRKTNRIARVSMGANALETNGASKCTAISPDGSVIAFHSKATNFVPGDTNKVKDIYCVPNPLYE